MHQPSDPVELSDGQLAQRDTSFRGDILRLLSGTGIAQFIGILVSPIVARLFAPEAFGLSAVFAALTLLFGAVACLRYELSISLPADDRDAANLFGVSLCAAALVSFLIAVIVWVGRPWLPNLIGIPEAGPYLWLLPVAVLLHGIYAALNYWNTRTRHFARLAAARVTNQVAVSGGFLVAGFSGLATAGSMIAASIVGQFLSMLVLGAQIARDNGKFLLANIGIEKMRAGLRRHRKFPLYGTWSALLNTLSWILPVLLLGSLFSSAVAGYYALGFRVLQMPMKLIGGTVSNVFIQRAASAKNEGALADLVENLFEKLVIVSLLPLVMLSIVGRDLYVVVFGARWEEAGVYAQLLSIWAFVWFVSSPLSQLFSVLEKQEFGLRLNFALLLTRLGSFSLGAWLSNARLALVLYGVTGIAVYGYMSMRLLDEAGVERRRVLQILSSAIALAAPFAGLVLFSVILGLSGVTVIGACILSYLIYIGILTRRHPRWFRH